MRRKRQRGRLVSESLLQLSHPEAAGAMSFAPTGTGLAYWGYEKSLPKQSYAWAPALHSFQHLCAEYLSLSSLAQGQSLGAYCSQWKNEEAETQRGYNKQPACILSKSVQAWVTRTEWSGQGEEDHSEPFPLLWVGHAEGIGPRGSNQASGGPDQAEIPGSHPIYCCPPWVHLCTLSLFQKSE